MPEPVRSPYAATGLALLLVLQEPFFFGSIKPRLALRSTDPLIALYAPVPLPLTIVTVAGPTAIDAEQLLELRSLGAPELLNAALRLDESTVNPPSST